MGSLSAVPEAPVETNPQLQLSALVRFRYRDLKQAAARVYGVCM